MFFHVIMTQCVFDKLRAVKTVRFYKRCFLITSPKWGKLSKKC